MGWRRTLSDAVHEHESEAVIRDHMDNCHAVKCDDLLFLIFYILFDCVYFGAYLMQLKPSLVCSLAAVTHFSLHSSLFLICFYSVHSSCSFINNEHYCGFAVCLFTTSK